MQSLEDFIKNTKQFQDNDNKAIIYTYDNVETYICWSLQEVNPFILDYRWYTIDACNGCINYMCEHGSHSESLTFVGNWDHIDIRNVLKK
jgi:hypothetical protein